MPVPEASVIRRAEARRFFEGPEECREYFRSGSLWFGTSVVPAGERGGLDGGHPGCTEVFYCTQGEVTVEDGIRGYELRQGDSLVIPAGLPHTIVNTGAVAATVVWAGGPDERG